LIDCVASASGDGFWSCGATGAEEVDVLAFVEGGVGAVEVGIDFNFV